MMMIIICLSRFWFKEVEEKTVSNYAVWWLHYDYLCNSRFLSSTNVHEGHTDTCVRARRYIQNQYVFGKYMYSTWFTNFWLFLCSAAVQYTVSPWLCQQCSYFNYAMSRRLFGNTLNKFQKLRIAQYS
jgi:hypothetical protein